MQPKPKSLVYERNYYNNLSFKKNKSNRHLLNHNQNLLDKTTYDMMR